MITCHAVCDEPNKILAEFHNMLYDNMFSMSDYTITIAWWSTCN